jgi:hypothetical protein
MTAVVVVLLLALALAATVLVYAAYPYRGAETPGAPVVGRVLRRGVQRLPTLDTSREQEPTRTR